MNLCKSCRWWIFPEKIGYSHSDNICKPWDDDTGEPMKMPFEVRECCHPKLVKFERTPEENGFGVSDGSNYMARLCTGPDFGCVRHENI